MRVLSRNLSSTDRLYLMTRHFIWLVPLISFLFFLAMGVFLALATRLWPRRAGWLSPRLIGTASILPALLVAGRGIHTEAWLIFAMGLASWLTPWLERHSARLRRWLLLSFPVLLGIVLAQAGLVFGIDRIKQWREEGRDLPPSGSTNVLLIVLDTLRADHLSLYGYERGTTPNLERLAKQGIRFDQARAPAPWTLASHASLFTGRWPHELAVKWMFPLRDEFPTLAEYLGSLGYATAGFVGNRFYCAYDSGLDRGFTHYEDYDLETLSALRTVHMIDRSVKSLVQLGPALGRILPIGASLTRQGLGLLQLSSGQRKDAQVINREFLDWLARRPEPRRPFFAFLNYVDTHAPYVMRPGARYPFGTAPATESDLLFLVDGWLRVQPAPIAPATSSTRPRFLRQLPRLSGRVARPFIRRVAAPGRARSDLDRDHFGSWRRIGRTRPLRSWREPLSYGNPRATPGCLTVGSSVPEGGRRAGQPPRHPRYDRRTHQPRDEATVSRPASDQVLVPASIRLDRSWYRRHRPLRTGVSESRRSQSRSLSGKTRSAGLTGRGRFRVYPKRR